MRAKKYALTKTERKTKRFFDIFFAFLGLSLVGWLIILIALISRFFIGGKGFFKQKRVGQHGMLFTIYKIETINPKGLIKESSKISTPSL